MKKYMMFLFSLVLFGEHLFALENEYKIIRDGKAYFESFCAEHSRTKVNGYLPQDVQLLLDSAYESAYHLLICIEDNGKEACGTRQDQYNTSRNRLPNHIKFYIPMTTRDGKNSCLLDSYALDYEIRNDRFYYNRDLRVCFDYSSGLPVESSNCR